MTHIKQVTGHKLVILVWQKHSGSSLLCSKLATLLNGQVIVGKYKLMSTNGWIIVELTG